MHSNYSIYLSYNYATYDFYIILIDKSFKYILGYRNILLSYTGYYYDEKEKTIKQISNLKFLLSVICLLLRE